MSDAIYYMLVDGQVSETHDPIEWAQWYAAAADEGRSPPHLGAGVVWAARANIGEHVVETVFRSFERQREAGIPPALFETRVRFRADTDSVSIVHLESFSTFAEAMLGHDAAVASLELLRDTGFGLTRAMLSVVGAGIKKPAQGGEGK